MCLDAEGEDGMRTEEESDEEFLREISIVKIE